VGEAGRVLPGGHKSAEPAKAGREGTSDPENGPASESAKERETEPMAEAPSEGAPPTRKWVGWSKDLWSAGARVMGVRQGRRATRRQHPGKPARPGGRNPHGVESAPTADEELTVELGNPPAFPAPSGDGWPKRPASARSGDGACVVVRGRESRPHGEGRQWIHLVSRRWTACPTR